MEARQNPGLEDVGSTPTGIAIAMLEIAIKIEVALRWRNGTAAACKPVMSQFDSGPEVQLPSFSG